MGHFSSNYFLMLVRRTDFQQLFLFLFTIFANFFAVEIAILCCNRPGVLKGGHEKNSCFGVQFTFGRKKSETKNIKVLATSYKRIFRLD